MSLGKHEIVEKKKKKKKNWVSTQRLRLSSRSSDNKELLNNYQCSLFADYPRSFDRQ